MKDSSLKLSASKVPGSFIFCVQTLVRKGGVAGGAIPGGHQKVALFEKD